MERQVSVQEFIEALTAVKPEGDGRAMMCVRRGDPSKNVDANGKSVGWPADVLTDWRVEDALDANLYAAVSYFRKQPYTDSRGRARDAYRRHLTHFVAAFTVMVDDLGTGAGAKHPLSAIEKLPPSILIETSPANYQALYLLRELETDKDRFKRLIEGIIKQGLSADADPGMRGATRLFRLPFGINGKAKYRSPDGKPFRLRLALFEPNRRYTVDEIAAAFDIDMAPKPHVHVPFTPEDKSLFRRVVAMLQAMNAFTNKDDHRLKGGWRDGDSFVVIECPFSDEHNNTKDKSGCGIRPYCPETQSGPLIFCQHGHGTKHRYADYVRKIAANYLVHRAAQKEAAAQQAELAEAADKIELEIFRDREKADIENVKAVSELNQQPFDFDTFHARSGDND